MENQGNRSNSQDSFPENLRKQTVLRGSVSLSEEHRFRCIEISFSAQEGGRERLALELPLRVKRTEARGVAEGLACINAHLEDCEEFMLAPVSGKISLEMIAEGGSEEARSSSVADALEILERYSDEILELVVTETIVADCREQDAAREPFRGEKRPSLRDRIFRLLGIADG